MSKVQLSKVLDHAKKTADDEIKQQKLQEQRKLTHEEVEAAWAILNPGGGYSWHRPAAEATLKVFYPDLTSKQSRDLLGHAGALTCEKLQELLVDNAYQDLDANACAFQILDPTGTGYLDMDILQRIMKHVGHLEQVTNEDIKAVMAVADADMDGKISLQVVCRLCAIANVQGQADCGFAP
eukprot:jgi/Chrzof1/23/Cz01g00240.t1